MARRSNTRAADPFQGLAAQVEILERELAALRDALQRLKDMARTARADGNGQRAGRHAAAPAFPVFTSVRREFDF